MAIFAIDQESPNGFSIWIADATVRHTNAGYSVEMDDPRGCLSRDNLPDMESIRLYRLAPPTSLHAT